jgi:osmoprotectant transport system ATP-binding protein
LSAVTLHQIGKDYAGTVVLSNINASLPAGAIIALIGRSGCGKSTLLRMINGLVVPDRGHLDVLGQAIDYSALTPLRRRIGYAVQGSGLFPHLTVAENILLPATLENWQQEQCTQRLHQLLDMMQLERDFAPRYPRELSGGQQQRVGLARALMLNPPLLLLDEPFAALDPLTRLELHEQILQLQALEPRTMLLVTHDMREALKLADSIVVMDGGQFVLQSTTQELQAQYPELEAEQLLLTLLEHAT